MAFAIAAGRHPKFPTHQPITKSMYFLPCESVTMLPFVAATCSSAGSSLASASRRRAGMNDPFRAQLWRRGIIGDQRVLVVRKPTGSSAATVVALFSGAVRIEEARWPQVPVRESLHQAARPFFRIALSSTSAQRSLLEVDRSFNVSIFVQLLPAAHVNDSAHTRVEATERGRRSRSTATVPKIVPAGAQNRASRANSSQLAQSRK